ncbi:ETX/MTX2 family pore-forming toxin [Bacillus cereus]|nr:ETX/MTX2 family pore-forming toxin [Bacillus cereus]
MIVDLYRYLGGLAAVNAVLHYVEPRPDVCRSVHQEYDLIVFGDRIPTFRVDPSQININNLSVDTPLDDITINNVRSVQLINSRFENEGFVDTENYFTPELSRTVVNSISTSTTTGYKFTQSLTVSSKFSLNFPVAGAENNISFSVGFEQNLSTTETITESISNLMRIPPQSVSVRPRTAKRIEISLFELAIPRTSNEISGFVTGTLPASIHHISDLYAVLTRTDSLCPNSYINRDNFLRIDHENRGVGLQGFGFLSGNVTSIDFAVRTTEYDLPSNTIINIENEIKRAHILTH